MQKKRGFTLVEALVGLAVLAVLVAGVWQKQQDTSTNTTIGENVDITVPTPLRTNLPKETGPSGEEQSIYYYKHRPNTLSIYQFNLAGPALQEKVLELSGKYQVFGKYKKPGQYLIGSENKLSVLDVHERKTLDLPALGVPNGMSLASASLSTDKKLLAYVIDNTLKQVDKGKAELWFYNLETQEKKKIFEDTLGLYAGLRVLGWNKTDEHIVLRETGGDAGAVWGQLFIVNTKVPYKSQEIKQASSGKDFLLGQLSPDGNRWLFSECDHPGEAPVYYQKDPCAEGERLKVYDLLTQRTQQIYQNTSHGNNLSKDKLRIIFDSKWQSDDKAIISTPDGISQVELPARSSSRFYGFTWQSPDEIYADGTRILLANLDFIIFEQTGNYAGKFILDLTSGRVTEFGGKDFDIRDFEGFFE